LLLQSASELRLISEPESETRTDRQATNVQRKAGRQEFTRERLVVLGLEIERRADVCESRELHDVADDRDAVFEVAEYLRVATDRSERARQSATLLPLDRENSEAALTAGNLEPASACRSVRSDDDVLRSDERIDRRDRADRTHVVTANREFVAEEEPLEDRHAVDKRKRLRVSDFICCREAAELFP
jgi:hypothetical protein